MTNSMVSSYIGIDVSKGKLDIAVACSHEFWRVDNDAAGIQVLVGEMKKRQPAGIIIEASGGWEQALLSELCAAKQPVALVNPVRVRAFAHSLGQKAKTDRLDAQLLARFGATLRPPCHRLRSNPNRLIPLFHHPRFIDQQHTIRFSKRFANDCLMNGQHRFSWPLTLTHNIARIAPDGKLSARQKRRMMLEMVTRRIRPGAGSSSGFLKRRTAMNIWPDLRKVLHRVE